jgi:hypothetical protein
MLQFWIVQTLAVVITQIMEVSSIDYDDWDGRNEVEFEQPEIADHCSPEPVEVFFNRSAPPAPEGFLHLLVAARTENSTQFIRLSRHGGPLMDPCEGIVWWVFVWIVGDLARYWRHLL